MPCVVGPRSGQVTGRQGTAARSPKRTVGSGDARSRPADFVRVRIGRQRGGTLEDDAYAPTSPADNRMALRRRTTGDRRTPPGPHTRRALPPDSRITAAPGRSKPAAPPPGAAHGHRRGPDAGADHGRAPRLRLDPRPHGALRPPGHGHGHAWTWTDVDGHELVGPHGDRTEWTRPPRTDTTPGTDTTTVTGAARASSSRGHGRPPRLSAHAASAPASRARYSAPEAARVIHVTQQSVLDGTTIHGAQRSNLPKPRAPSGAVGGPALGGGRRSSPFAQPCPLHSGPDRPPFLHFFGGTVGIPRNGSFSAPNASAGTAGDFGSTGWRRR